MTTPKARFLEFDILRFLALLLVLYTHSNEYIGKLNPWEWYRVAATYTSLGLFVFLSGYGLQHSASDQLKANEFNKTKFFLKRISKIYPLYILALIGFLVIFNIFNIYHSGNSWRFIPFPSNFIIHILSLQGLLDSIFPSVKTLWFIGMIIPFYIFFVFTVSYKTSKFIQANGIIILLLLIIENLFQIIDLRLIFYYPIFIFGAIASRQEFMKLLRSKQEAKILIFAGFLASGSYWLYKYLNLPSIKSDLIYDINNLSSYVLITIFVFSVIPCLLIIASRLSRFLTKIQSQLIYLSNLSYAAYLFHRLVYGVAYYLFNEFDVPWNLKVSLFPVVTLLVFGTADVLCRLERYLWKWWRRQNPKMAG